MSVFMAFALGTLTGAVLGGIGVVLFIKETRVDIELMDEPVVDIRVGGEPVAHCRPAPAPALDWDELEEPIKEVKYGKF